MCGFGGNCEICVREGVVVNRGAKGGFHVLPAFKSVEGGVGLQADATNGGIQLLEAARCAYEGAAGAEPGDEVGNATGGLFPNFVGGASIVRLPVRGIAVLIRIEVLFGIGGNDLMDAADGAVGGFVAGSHDELGAECIEDALALD